jgi:hypothetical protein
LPAVEVNESLAIHTGARTARRPRGVARGQSELGGPLPHPQSLRRHARSIEGAPCLKPR